MSTPSGSDPSGPEPSVPTGPSAPPPAQRPGLERRRPLIAAVLALALVVGVVVAIFSFSRTGSESQAPVVTETATPSDTATPTPTETTPPPAPAAPPPPEPIADLPPVAMNVLLIGSDSRGNAREQAANTAATGASSDHRADSLMLVHVPADRHTFYVISLMRDLWVDIPGYGGSKINSSLEVGGIDLATRTVESLLGVHVDHTVMLDFHGFKLLTDGLGGIDVDVAIPFQSTIETQHVFTAGINHLDGQAALEFCRERYAFVDGDFQRVRNQQIFLRAILAKLTSGGALNDVNAVRALVGFAASSLTVDQGFDPVSVAILAYALRNTDPNAAGFLTLPTAGLGNIGGASVVLPDYGGIAAVGAALREGRIADYAR